MTDEDAPDPEAVAPRVAPVLRRAQRAAPAPVIVGLPAAYGGLLGDVGSLADVPEPAGLASVAPRPAPAPPPLTPRPADGWLAPTDARSGQEDEDPRPTVVPLAAAPAISPGSTRRPRRVVQERPPLIAMTALGFFGLIVASVIGAGLWALLHGTERHATASPLSPITVTEVHASDATPAAAEPAAEPVAEDPAAGEPAAAEPAAEEETGTAPAAPAAKATTRRTTTPSKSATRPADEDPWAIPAAGTASTPVPSEPEKKKGLFGKKNK